MTTVEEQHCRLKKNTAVVNTATCSLETFTVIRLLCVEWDVKPYTLALSSSSYWRVVEVGDVHLGLSPLLLVVDPDFSGIIIIIIIIIIVLWHKVYKTRGLKSRS